MEEKLHRGGNFFDKWWKSPQKKNGLVEKSHHVSGSSFA